MGLLHDTIKLLRTDPGSSAEIAAEADLGESWLVQLRRGVYGDPGVCKIERLHAVLKKRAGARNRIAGRRRRRAA